MDNKSTHRIKFGKGKNRRSWLVTAGIPRTGSDGVQYFNCITTSKNKLGIRYIVSVPESNLQPLKESP